jgi:hypothetical protein
MLLVNPFVIVEPAASGAVLALLLLLLLLCVLVRTMMVKLYWLFKSLMPMMTVPRFAALPALCTPSGGLQNGME